MISTTWPTWVASAISTHQQIYSPALAVSPLPRCYGWYPWSEPSASAPTLLHLPTTYRFTCQFVHDYIHVRVVETHCTPPWCAVQNGTSGTKSDSKTNFSLRPSLSTKLERICLSNIFFSTSKWALFLEFFTCVHTTDTQISEMLQDLGKKKNEINEDRCHDWKKNAGEKKEFWGKPTK